MKLNLAPFYAQTSESPFKERWAVMPFGGTVPVDKAQIQTTWQKFQSSILPAAKRLMYIHIPFCATHCQFCGFYQNPLRHHDTEIYTRYLIQELIMDAGSELTMSAPIHAVYFGGGTPSALTSDQLYQIITTIKLHYPLAPDCEITIEGRILDFTDDKIDACLDAGANRFSIGIQTFDTTIRKRLGRTSTKKQAIEFLTKLALKDKAAVVCDLMFGLPKQTIQTWKEDLAIVNDLPLDGADLYALNLLPTTPLYKGVESKRIVVANAKERAEFYQTGVEFLDDCGWQQLSNSHFGKTTRERNLYNLLIKQGANYFAFGSCAGGKLNGQSFMLERNLTNYYAQLDEQKKPIMMMLKASKPLIWLQRLQGGIEAGRVDLTKLTTQVDLIMPLIKQWHQTGLLINDSSILRLTTSGRFWASNLLFALQKLLMILNEPDCLNQQIHMPHHHSAHPMSKNDSSDANKIAADAFFNKVKENNMQGYHARSE